MRLFDPFLYEKAHVLVLLVLTLFYYSILKGKNAKQLILRSNTQPLIFLYVFIFIFVVGFRPVVYAFGDTVNYAHGYEEFSLSPERILFESDSLFYLFMWTCAQFMSVNWFFFLVEILYVVPIVIACYRLLHANMDIGLLFCFAAFSFFAYGVNGLRNGVACSFIFLAITFIRGSIRDKVICSILTVIAVGFHISVLLPAVCMLAAFFVRRPGILFYFWVISIVISLVAGSSVANFFANLGFFEDRISDYIHPDIEEDLFTETGFRWDFLLYSAAPIFLGWYIIFKRKVYEKTYLLLLGTYIFANAFWIMVIRAEFSNRFAYLSWFLYPIVIAYPLLKLKIWPKTQGQKTALIMLAHLAFTLFMVFIVY